MNLVRLALEVAPERTKEILRQIQEHDSEVTRLWREIAAVPELPVEEEHRGTGPYGF